MRFFRKVCVFVLGLTYFLSGLFKLMDPVGASFVVSSWMGFLHIGFLGFFSGVIAEGFALAESVVGIALLSRVWKKPVAFATFLLTGFFTILTILLVICNPQMDCGCFGEVIHLTHWQSFIKNIILLGLCCGAFLPFSKLVERPGKMKFASFSLASASVLLFAFYSLLSLPLVDYSSFKPGSELLRLPEADIEVEHQESPMDVELSFFDASGNYRDSLAWAGNVMAVSVPEPDRLSDSYWGSLSDLLKKSNEAGLSTLVLVCADPEEFASKVQDVVILSNTYFGDFRILSTINRSNGGATLISDGQIVRKWSRRSLPKNEDIMEFLASDPTEYQMKHTMAGTMKLQAFCLYAAAVLLLL